MMSQGIRGDNEDDVNDSPDGLYLPRNNEDDVNDSHQMMHDNAPRPNMDSEMRMSGKCE